MTERLKKLLSECMNNPEKTCPRPDEVSCDGCKHDLAEGCDMIGRYADYLLSNGVIVPPCIEGTTVYEIHRKCKGSMDCLYNGGREIWRCHYKNECRCDGFIDETKFELCMLKDVGKTVFLTREEAEKALAERSNDGKN